LLVVAACGEKPARVDAPSVATATDSRPSFELVESAPLETELDHPFVRNASEVWPEMITRAARTLDFAEFYASEAEGDAVRDSKLAPAIAAVCAATKRGVRVRFLVDATMAPKYPSTLDALRACNVDVRALDQNARAGGVLHAKYFIRDGAESFIGSQNFDWRSLAHIQEMGARVESPEIARALGDVFALDWAAAEATDAGGAHGQTAPAPSRGALDVRLPSGEIVSLVGSPEYELPDPAESELTKIIALLDGAKTRASIQSLTYSTKIQHGRRKGATFTALDAAIRRTAARGVSVQLLVSSWATRSEDGRDALSALATTRNVEVRVITIPAFSGGEIPYARVAHSKYLVVDDRHSWIGTSNWEGDYFVQSRDVAFVVDSPHVAADLRRVFDDAWSSKLTSPLSNAASRVDAGP
jgi:phosphatidylserine/phosphatidylglycerophosphate/cardiolipin synthase-like enzyme